MTSKDEVNLQRPTGPGRTQKSDSNYPFKVGICEIDNLDLSPIRFRVHGEHCQEEGYCIERLDEWENVYRAFLALIKKHPNTLMVPNQAVDVFWHNHVLDTQKYEEDCKTIFGETIHHFPYFGLRGEDDMGKLKKGAENTAKLLNTEFPALKHDYFDELSKTDDWKFACGGMRLST